MASEGKENHHLFLETPEVNLAYRAHLFQAPVLSHSPTSKTYFKEEFGAIVMEWLSHDLECQEFGFGKRTLQRLKTHFGCSVYPILPQNKLTIISG